jgi:RNA polymerase sigma-54 factor
MSGILLHPLMKNYSLRQLWQESQRYEIETWRETLKLIQNFDPEGVAARDLQECLLIQARSERSENNLVENIIKNQWDNFLNRKCDAVAKNLCVPLYDVHAAISVVSSFDPDNGLTKKSVLRKTEGSPIPDKK